MKQKSYIDIEETPVIEHDGVKMDSEILMDMAVELAHSTSQYWQLLHNASNRVVNEQYGIGVTIAPRDIIVTGPEMEKCRIICPGPNLANAEVDFDDGWFSIVCNKAVESHWLDGALWLVADINAKKCDWFLNAHRGNSKRSKCFTHHLLVEYNPDYTMHVAPCFAGLRDGRLISGIIMNGATIAGMALQVGFYRGAKVIELVGCDFGGDTYHDGSHAAGHADWFQYRTRMNSYIRMVQMKGVEVYSRTDTTLDIEVRK